MSIPKQLLEETQKRYEERESDRLSHLQKIKSGLLLTADNPIRVEKRLERLGIEPSVAEALALSNFTLLPTTKPNPELDRIGLERFIGTSDLMSVNYLELGLIASRCVGRIRIRNATDRILGYGTGFMVSPRLLLTNNHVLENARQASFSKVEFNFQEGTNGQPQLSAVFNLDPKAFFITDKQLDYTLVAVKEGDRNGLNLSSFGWKRLIEEEGKVILGEYVSIIQHPGGEPKQLALRENQLIDVLDDFLHYQTDTAPGSSGSPVFNDQWEVVALHHSGVPDEKDGSILSIDGTPWTPDMGEHRLAWKANEGVRVSRIVKHIKSQKLSSEQQRLRNELFEAESSSIAPSAIAPEDFKLAIAKQGSAVWTIPLQVSVNLGQPAIAADSTTDNANKQKDPVIFPKNNQDLDEALEELEAARNKDYYNVNSDRQNRDRYYDNILSSRLSLNQTEFYQELRDLLAQTHKTQLKYKPSTHLYPWVDLHPDTQLQSIYSGQTFDPEEIIREDFQIAQIKALRHRELILKEATISPEEMQKEIDLLEASFPYNCEHVVPQSWFYKHEPMRGDLHHLFTCEVKCNSYRSNYPFFDFPDFEESVRDRCGKLSEDKFEPGAGKGAVARATLYFLLRYPGEINKTENEYKEERLKILLKWHDEHPVSEYEQHRNMAIFEKQGNRNPLIDFPEWADKIAFRLGLGKAEKPKN